MVPCALCALLPLWAATATPEHGVGQPACVDERLLIQAAALVDPGGRSPPAGLDFWDVLANTSTGGSKESEHNDPYSRIIDNITDWLGGGRRRYTVTSPRPSPYLTHEVPQGTEIVIFGDSWLSPNVSWGMQLGSMLGLKVRANFAVSDSTTQQVFNQVEDATPILMSPGDLLAIIHTGGSDILKYWGDSDLTAEVANVMAEVFDDKVYHMHAKRVMSKLSSALEYLYFMGVRRFLVSEIPITTAVPLFRAIEQLINDTALHKLVSTCLDKKGEWLNAALGQSLANFKASHPQADLGYLPEVSNLWSMAQNDWTHEWIVSGLSVGVTLTAEGHRLLAELAAPFVQVAAAE